MRVLKLPGCDGREGHGVSSAALTSRGWRRWRRVARRPMKCTVHIRQAVQRKAKMVKICLQCRSPRFDSWVGKIPPEKDTATHSSILDGESHIQRNLVGYSPWGRKESDTTEWLTLISKAKDRPEKWGLWKLLKVAIFNSADSLSKSASAFLVAARNLELKKKKKKERKTSHSNVLCRQPGADRYEENLSGAGIFLWTLELFSALPGGLTQDAVLRKQSWGALWTQLQWPIGGGGGGAPQGRTVWGPVGRLRVCARAVVLNPHRIEASLGGLFLKNGDAQAWLTCVNQAPWRFFFFFLTPNSNVRSRPWTSRERLKGTLPGTGLPLPLGS